MNPADDEQRARDDEQLARAHAIIHQCLKDAKKADKRAARQQFWTDAKRVDEKTLDEVHTVSTYTAVSGAICLAVLGAAPPLALVALPLATYIGRWLYKKGKSTQHSETATEALPCDKPKPPLGGCP